jgi:hypothetical protein
VAQSLNRHLFTIVLNGRGILTFDASSLEMAEELAASAQFQAHLMNHDTDAGSVWDGRQPLQIREADFKEIETWASVFRANGEPEQGCLVWLLPVTGSKPRHRPH